MIHEHSLVIIPHWVYAQLKRNSMNIEDCLNFNKIKPIMSAEDLAGFLAVQNSVEYLVGTEITRSGQGDLLSKWISSANEANLSFLANTVHVVATTSNCISMVKEQLYDEGSRQDHHTEPFIIYEMDRNVTGMLVYPGFFTIDANPELHFTAVKAILGSLYVNSASPNLVSATSWFRRYLELLVAKVQP